MVDVLLPRSEPGDSVVVDDSSPLGTLGRRRNLGFRSDVDRDHLGSHSSLTTTFISPDPELRRRCETHLEETRLGMLSTTPEETRRLNAEVTQLLDPPIEETRLVRFLNDVPRCFDCLLLGCADGLLGCLLRLEVIEHGSEIALLEVINLRSTELRTRSRSVTRS